MNKLILLPFFLVLFLWQCSRQKQSNYHVDQFWGTTLNGEKIQLKEVQARRIALNVYSPTCVPCYKELPALHHIYAQMQKAGAGQMYLAIDPDTILDDTEGLSEQKKIQQSIQIMKKEKQKRQIEIPILIMSKPFIVQPQGGLITGTPETLLFDTQPLALFYNFIGPISEEKLESAIINDPRVIFFKRTFGGLL